MISLIIAGGLSLAANTTSTQWPDFDNHTLKGETIASSKVVCRDMWGTPMLPNNKAGYSLIAPINPDYIQESLIQPPSNPRGMVAYRPLPPVDLLNAPLVMPAPTSAPAPAPSAPAPAMSAAPVEAPLPTSTTPIAPADAPAAPPAAQ